MAALTDLTKSEEQEETFKGGTTRKTTTRHIGSVLDTLRKYETLASGQRSKLGLDPSSAARLGRAPLPRRERDPAGRPDDDRGEPPRDHRRRS
jgi:hypothetical protein